MFHTHLTRTISVPTGIVLKGLLAAGLLAVMPQAIADNVYKTAFEKPDFTAGLSLVGQDGWIAPPPLSPDAAVIATTNPRLGKQTVHVPGASLVPQDFIVDVTDGYYEALGSYRHAVNFDTRAKKLVRLSAQVRVDGPLTPGKDFFSASIAALTTDVNDGDAPSGIGALAISSDGHVYGFSGQDPVPVFLTGAEVSLGEWHELAIETDFATRTYSFFVDGRWLGTFAFDPSASSNIFLRGSIVVYGAPDTATHQKAQYSAAIDDFTIHADARRANH
jgi:hypothetical protein